jgi:hypothetical protein
MRKPMPDWAIGTKGTEARPNLIARELGVQINHRAPVFGPTESLYQRSRQPKGKIKRTRPGPRLAQLPIKRRPIRATLHRKDADCAGGSVREGRL